MVKELRQLIRVSLNNETNLLFLTLPSDKFPAAPEPLPQRERLVLLGGSAYNCTYLALDRLDTLMTCAW